MIHRLTFILRRRWPVVVALAVVGVVLGVAIGPRGGPTDTSYVASAVVSASQSGANQTEVQQDLVEASQGSVAAAVADELGGGATAQTVASAVGTSFDDETFVATLSGTAPTAEQAERLTAAFADAFVAEGNGGATAEEQEVIAAAEADRDLARAELQAFLTENDAELSGSPSALLESEQAALQAAYNAAENELSELVGTVRPGNVYELINVTEARVQAPGKLQALNSATFRGVLGLLMGLVGAALVVFAVERANPRIDDPEQAAAIVGAPVLAMVPVLGRRRRATISRVHPDDFKGPYAEAFRTMRSHLDFRANTEGRTLQPRIMVTSAAPSEGKSTTAAFLAMSYVESDRSPLVISGDFRRPSIHRLFDVDRVPGLTSRSAPGGTKIPLTDIIRRDPVSGVTIVPSGPAVHQINDVVADVLTVSEVAQASGQVVVLDTAPVRVANDAINFLAAVDWVIVVVQAGKSTQRSVMQMMQTLRLNGATVVGVVMLGSVEAADASRDYYAYYSEDDRRRGDRRRGDRRRGDRRGGDRDATVDIRDQAPAAESNAVQVS